MTLNRILCSLQCLEFKALLQRLDEWEMTHQLEASSRR